VELVEQVALLDLRELAVQAALVGLLVMVVMAVMVATVEWVVICKATLRIPNKLQRVPVKRLKSM
jgi:hypothetical protein